MAEGKNSRVTFQTFLNLHMPDLFIFLLLHIRSVLCWSLQRFPLCSIFEVKVAISTASQNIYMFCSLI